MEVDRKLGFFRLQLLGISFVDLQIVSAPKSAGFSPPFASYSSVLFQCLQEKTLLKHLAAHVIS